MYMLLQKPYSTPYNAKALKCKQIAKRFGQAILPTVRSYYFLWLEKQSTPCAQGGCAKGGCHAYP